MTRNCSFMWEPDAFATRQLFFFLPHARMTTLRKRRHKANNRYQPPPSRDSSLSQSTPPPLVFRRVLATDPDQTAALWNLVRAAASARMPPKRKNVGGDAEGGRPKKARRSGLRSGKGKENVSKTIPLRHCL